MPATLTMIGLYDERPDLFDLMDFPDGIDTDVVRDNILLKSAEFEVLYPDPDFVHDAIGMWSSKWYRTFSKWEAALEIEYDPLSNYDRTEDWTDTLSETENKTNSGSGSSSESGTTTDQSSVEVNESRSAYDSSLLQPTTKSTSGSSSSSSLSSQSSSNTSGTEATTKSNTARKTGHAYGNIGVTTSQQMLESELAIAKWNLVEHITDIFLSEFVIPIY